MKLETYHFQDFTLSCKMQSFRWLLLCGWKKTNKSEAILVKNRGFFLDIAYSLYAFMFIQVKHM